MSIPARIEPVGEIRAQLGEGPVWDGVRERLLWVDIAGRALHAVGPGAGDRIRSWALPGRIGSLAVARAPWTPPASRAGGAFYLACGDHGFGWLEITETDVYVVSLAHPERQLPGNRFNDGKLGPDGRYWAGTMDDSEQAATGSLYAFAADGGVQLLDSGYGVTNGPAFSPDGRTVYHCDSALQVIYAFTLAEDGGIRGKRTFAVFGPGEGYPDGMTTDRAGNLWVAMWDGHRVEKFAPDGRRLGAIAMPVPRCTSCCFAGGGEDTLYVTSASIGLESVDPLSGALFRVRLGDG